MTNDKKSEAKTDETEVKHPKDASQPDPLQRTILIAGGTLIVALALSWVFMALLQAPLGQRPRLEFFLRIKLLVSTFNVILLLILTGIYVRIYRDIPNPFTLSLILFTVALFFYALTSNPFVPLILGFRGGVGLGPFTFLPDLFATVAIVVLLYQSYK